MEIQKLAVIGSGFMGSGIAQVSAMGGLDVMIHDSNGEAANKAVETIRWSLGKLQSKGKFQGDPEEVMKRLKVAESMEDAKDCDMVIEAIFENVPAKHEVFEKLGGIVKPEAIIALYAERGFTLQHREIPADSAPGRKGHEELLILGKE